MFGWAFVLVCVVWMEIFCKINIVHSKISAEVQTRHQIKISPYCSENCLQIWKMHKYPLKTLFIWEGPAPWWGAGMRSKLNMNSNLDRHSFLPPVSPAYLSVEECSPGPVLLFRPHRQRNLTSCISRSSLPHQWHCCLSHSNLQPGESWHHVYINMKSFLCLVTKNKIWECCILPCGEVAVSWMTLRQCRLLQPLY